MSYRYLTYKYAIYKQQTFALWNFKVYNKRYTFKLKDPNALRDIMFQNVLLQRALFLENYFQRKGLFSSVLNNCISRADTHVFCLVSETKARFCDYLGQHRRMCVPLGLLKYMSTPNMWKLSIKR